MIKIKDLRIGNYVKHKKYPITYKVTAIGENGGWMQVTDEFEDIDSAIEKLEPIPLTEDWLERFGFDKIEGWFTKGRLELFNINNNYFTTPSRDIVSVDLIHVHQLQNLYYFLTGEELVLK